VYQLSSGPLPISPAFYRVPAPLFDPHFVYRINY